MQLRENAGLRSITVCTRHRDLAAACGACVRATYSDRYDDCQLLRKQDHQRGAAGHLASYVLRTQNTETTCYGGLSITLRAEHKATRLEVLRNR